MPYVALNQKDRSPVKYNLGRSVITIGRGSTNDVDVSDPFVSRYHAKIVPLGSEEYEIQDVGAKHPLKVNGRIISRKRLVDRDQIAIGGSVLIFRTGETGTGTQVEFVGPEDEVQESVEVASFNAKNTGLFIPISPDSAENHSLRRDHQRLMLLCEFGRSVNSLIEEPSRILDEILKTLFKTLDAERGFIALVDKISGELTCELVHDSRPGENSEDLKVSRTIFHKVLEEGAAVLTVNALKDSQFGQAESVREFKIRSALCAPLLSQDTVLGVVYLDNRASVGSFSRDDLMFLTAVCQQAGIALGNARLHRQVVQENIRLESALRPTFELVGQSPAMKNVYLTMQKVAPSDITVLIAGETGTGKELASRALHTLSLRSSAPFVAVNCAAIPKELIESELFGHEKGAFTDAVLSREGKFQEAEGGTLFLDEIGDMSLDTQSKILRALEAKEIQRVGGTGSIKVDVRVIAATNKDLQRAVDSGEFREDLYYRLNVVTLTMPSLRDRKEDILSLAEHFLAGRVKRIGEKAARIIMQYGWPGNVRELKNCMDHAVVMGDGVVIQPEDLPYSVRRNDKVISTPLGSLDMLEKDHIIRVLRYTGWHKSDAAKILGITRQTLDNKLDKFKLSKS
ncbi:MAG: sigma 54-interacting transcriptional regulator [Candidatus Aminicenantes bacterium]|nr:sigma 54-interacting transcriptional regulator [Candidatus Aminicenantes bacterium]